MTFDGFDLTATTGIAGPFDVSGYNVLNIGLRDFSAGSVSAFEVSIEYSINMGSSWDPTGTTILHSSVSGGRVKSLGIDCTNWTSVRLAVTTVESGLNCAADFYGNALRVA